LKCNIVLLERYKKVDFVEVMPKPVKQVTESILGESATPTPKNKRTSKPKPQKKEEVSQNAVEECE
jgi:hypothetical protein